MNALADPYPPVLADVDETPISVTHDAVTNRLITAVNRLAQALEQNTLAILDNGAPRAVQNAPGAALAALPPVQTAVPQAGGVCPIHASPWKVVPAGISKKTGNAYESFRACSVQGCDQRPPR